MSTTPTTRPELFEIVVAPSAPDAPPASLFSADGLWHTQDLFVVAPHGDDAPQYPHSERARPDPSGGRGWVYKGRAGDWIKTVTGFVDTRAIEDAVRRECADIVGDALVVGSGRIHPVLLVETLAAPTQPPDESLALRPHAPDGHTMNTSHAKHVKEAKLATEIVRRLEPLCGTLFPYERIARPHQVLVLPPGALLRNREKGNLRRDACEEAFREQIDAVFVSRG
ncbi:hypothetical protein PsYK624_015570 [Phanerochaete sordida]|uniref:Uncharacterized protein n=1 Tax=Phanerochaete sordida TaxID=48140 RepID=A0A9P3FZJ2_9APHY|nr:hypothetical protein PsYK624_015570 [Phanerochaete sordida]